MSARRQKVKLPAFPAAVLATLRRRGLGTPADRLLVALSGGPDSTALLAALAALREAGEVGPLSALHVDHQLRPGAADEAAAVATCGRLGVPLTVVRVKVGRGNVQAAARRARYAALRDEADRVEARWIATGHTRTDQAETVLLRLVRGAGARGLSGIPPRRGRLIRPLIDRPREEGLRWLESQGLAWCEDPTNASPRYARNRLRQRLWPLLLEANPSVEGALARTADLLRDDERALSARARRLAGDRLEVDAERLAAAPVAVQRRVVRRLARQAGGRAAAPEAVHVEAALALLGAGGDGRTQLRRGLVARRRGQLFRVEPARPEQAAPTVAPVEVRGPGRFPVPALGLAVEVKGDLAALGRPLFLRTRLPGDRFRPARGGGRKRLKAWLIDRKVERSRRDRLLLLVDGAGRVLAIPELGVADAACAGVAIRVTPFP